MRRWSYGDELISLVNSYDIPNVFFEVNSQIELSINELKEILEVLTLATKKKVLMVLNPTAYLTGNSGICIMVVISDNDFAKVKTLYEWRRGK